MAEPPPTEAPETPPPSEGGDPEPRFEVTIDPFTRHDVFADSVLSGRLRSTFQWFLDQWREPINVRADRILDLDAFGRDLHAFLKMPRTKRADELPDGHEDRMKEDLERQFILRNLMRYVKTINKGDPLEFGRLTVGLSEEELNYRGALIDQLHKPPDLLAEGGLDHVRRELGWRRHFVSEMRWERYFSKEIRDDFQGPLWKHDPDTNPIQSKVADAVLNEGREERGDE